MSPRPNTHTRLSDSQYGGSKGTRLHHSQVSPGGIGGEGKGWDLVRVILLVRGRVDWTSSLNLGLRMMLGILSVPFYFFLSQPISFQSTHVTKIT